MTEERSHKLESAQEYVPDREAVHAVLRELIGAKEYTVTRELSDRRGCLVLMEVEVLGEMEGEIIEYAYMLKGVYGGNSSAAIEIYKTIYENGIPVTGGDSAVRHENGSWVIYR